MFGVDNTIAQPLTRDIFSEMWLCCKQNWRGQLSRFWVRNPYTKKGADT